LYVAQASPQFDAEIAKKGHLWMETRLKAVKLKCGRLPLGLLVIPINRF